MVFSVELAEPGEQLEAELPTRTCNLEPHVRREAKESVTAKVV
jgi:hypothetical protein